MGAYSRAALAALKAAEALPLAEAGPVVVQIDAVFIPYQEWILADIDNQIWSYRNPPSPKQAPRPVVDAAATDALPVAQEASLVPVPQGSLFQ